MKPNLCKFIILNTLVLFATGCMQHTAKRETSTKLNDGQIVDILQTVNKLEISTSDIALKKKGTLQLEAYAQYLIDQHEKKMDELKELAARLNIKTEASPISEKLSAERKEMVDSLGKLQGEAFDKAYIDAMVNSHEGGLHLLETMLIPEAQNAQLRDFVVQFKEMVEHHLERAKEVQKSLNS